MSSNDTDSRVNLRIPQELKEHLDRVEKLGIYGSSTPDVSRTLIGLGLEQLILKGIINLDNSHKA